MFGFKRFETAAVTIRGIELTEKIKKHQFNLKSLTGKETHRSGNLGGGCWPHETPTRDHSNVYHDILGPSVLNGSSSRTRAQCRCPATGRG
jgi:hypothetical protein